MGERFSWDKLLRRDKKADNTIEVNPNDSSMGPVVPLGRTDDLNHGSAKKQVNGPLMPQNEPELFSPPENRAPLVIDWESYRAQAEQDLTAPVEPIAPATPINYSEPITAPPVMAMPPVSEVPPIPFQESESPTIEQRVELPVQHTEVAKAGWDDVELTPREMTENSVPATTNFQETEGQQFSAEISSPRIESTQSFDTPPPIPVEPEQSNPVIADWDSPVVTPQVDNVSDLKEDIQPTEPVATVTNSSGIPDIFAKAMGLKPEQEIVTPQVQTPPASSVWTSSSTGYVPPVTPAVKEVPVSELSTPSEPSVSSTEQEPSSELGGKLEEPVADFKVYEESLPNPNAIPEQYTKTLEPLDVQQARDRKLGSVLIDNKLITQRQLDRALERQAQTREKLGAILIAMQTMSERRLLQVLAAQKGVSPWHLEEDFPAEEALKLVPEEMCRVYQVLPVTLRGDLLLLAMRDPEDREAVENIRQHTKMRVEPVLADEARLAYSIDTAYGVVKARRAVALDKYVAEAMAGLAELKDSHSEKAILSEEETRPVEGLVNHIIEEAIRMHASDIHFEPREESSEIRYRLDGQLMKMREIPSELMPLVSARVKLMGDLDLADLKNPLDGRSQFKFGSNQVGLRISVLPNFHGARIVMRILDKAVGLRAMDKLGFESQNLEMFRELIAKPYGLFLVTGPTGSGKTTTLYAAVEELKQTATNIMTCEDPVEYDINGINQSEVQERTGLTFGKQLKAILRQDPDVVLIGEIRDAETADIAIRAATSGHMVLATMHCNDAVSAVPKLYDMGIDAHSLSSALVGTLSQRLIRVLCPSCKKSATPTEEESSILTKNFGLENVEQVWHACGCEECMNTGYKGRTGVHEVLPVTDEVSTLVENRARPEEIKKAASYYGYLPMQQDAITRVLAGETTVEEAMRVLAIDTIEKRSAPRTIQVPKAG